jgi:hypothetical protein
MKLSLTSDQSLTFAQAVPAGLTPTDAILSGLRAMRAGNHHPWTRRDLWAVLFDAGYSAKNDALMAVWNKRRDIRKCYATGADKAPGMLTYPADLSWTVAAPSAEGEPSPLAGIATVISRAGVVFIPAQPELDETTVYNHDIGLAQMAAQATPCFGLYEAGHKTCGACPLQASCAPATYSRIEEIARDLDASVQATLAAAAKQAATPAEEAEVTNSVGFDKAAANQNSDLFESPALRPGAVRRVAPFDAPCTSCGIVILAGDTGTHLPEEGYFHEACASAYPSS